MFNYTSLSILKVLLTSCRLLSSFAVLFLSVGAPLSFSFAVLSSSPDCALLCCAFASLGRVTFFSLTVLLESLAHAPLCSLSPLHSHQLIFSLFQ